MSDIKCPVCGKSCLLSFGVKDNTGKQVNWHYCRCQSLFHKDGIDKKIFDDKYRENWQDMKGIEDRFDYLLRQYVPIIEELTYGRKFLDVGFTLPAILTRMKERGWVSTGIDLILENGYIVGDFENYVFHDSVDFIHWGHVLESFEDHQKAFRKAYDLLNELGCLLITTPCPLLLHEFGVPAFGHWTWKEKHLFISPAQLKRLAIQNNFIVILGRENISKRFVSWNDYHLILQKV